MYALLKSSVKDFRQIELFILLVSFLIILYRNASVTGF